MYEKLYELIRDVRRREKIKKEWEEGPVPTIFKKGDREERTNYVITLYIINNTL